MSSEEISPPAHVGVIMDGNRRWAIAQGKNKKQGHRAGIDALREIIRSAPLAGVKRLTAYGFSLDNWQREEEEVDNLMELLRNFLQED